MLPAIQRALAADSPSAGFFVKLRWRTAEAQCSAASKITMLVLPRTSTDAEVLAAVNAFVRLLAQNKYVEAYDMAHHTPEREWTPQLIERVVEGYGSIERVFKFEDGKIAHVTLPEEVTEPESPQRHEVTWFDKAPDNFPTFVGYVHYDLPLNGEWSDLTLIFDILEAQGGLVLSLNDIHVL